MSHKDEPLFPWWYIALCVVFGVWYVWFITRDVTMTAVCEKSTCASGMTPLYEHDRCLCVTEARP